MGFNESMLSRLKLIMLSRSMNLCRPDLCYSVDYGASFKEPLPSRLKLWLKLHMSVILQSNRGIYRVISWAIHRVMYMGINI